MALRIGLGGIWHETNTFAPGETTLEDFDAYQLQRGPALLDAHRGAGTELGGALAACHELGAEPTPLVFAAALPGATVTAEAWTRLRDEVVDSAACGPPLDGIVLALHGAMVADGTDDPESELIAALARALPAVPVAVTLDLHANPGAALLDGSAVVAGYDTYPHVDMAARGHEASSRLVALLAGSTRPTTAWRRVPLLSCPLGQATDEEPMRSLVALAHALERGPGTGAVSVLPGYPYADVDRLGLTVVAQAAAAERATDCADELAAAAWARRAAFERELVPADEAVARALAGPGPTVLADVADNVGGGSPGDGTVLLYELLAAGARDAVVVIADPAAAAACAAAGRGARVALEVGGRADRLHGDPVALSGIVVDAAPVAYTRTGSYMRGQRVDLGTTAVVDTGGVEVVLTTRRAMPFDTDHLTAVGIDPARRRALVVKSAIAWRAAFGAIARDVVYVDTPGVCPGRLDRLAYSARRRLWPIDPAATPGAVGS